MLRDFLEVAALTARTARTQSARLQRQLLPVVVRARPYAKLTVPSLQSRANRETQIVNT